MAHEELIASTAFFANAGKTVLASLAKAATEISLVRGDVIFEEGSDPDALFIVIAGRIAIAIANEVDDRESVITLMGPGELFGDLGILDGGSRSAGARAIEPSRVLRIPADAVVKILKSDTNILWNVVHMLAGRLRSMDDALADSVFLDVTGRTAKRLLEISAGRDEFTLPVTQEELAGMVGASRERVNKAIASFIRLGWIQQRDRQYLIVKRDELELRAK
jgi:CRP-like cAMP-binding protein